MKRLIFWTQRGFWTRVHTITHNNKQPQNDVVGDAGGGECPQLSPLFAQERCFGDPLSLITPVYLHVALFTEMEWERENCCWTDIMIYLYSGNEKLRTNKDFVDSCRRSPPLDRTAMRQVDHRLDNFTPHTLLCPWLKRFNCETARSSRLSS
jgi:hypothetical protein